MRNAVGLEGARAREPGSPAYTTAHLDHAYVPAHLDLVSLLFVEYDVVGNAVGLEGGRDPEGEGQAPLHRQQLNLIVPMSKLTLILYPSSVLSMM
jgi:hypothetical protein